MRDHSRTHRFHGDIAEHDRPAGSFLNEGETGMRAARGGQGVTRNGVLSLREGRQHVQPAHWKAGKKRSYKCLILVARVGLELTTSAL
jgi:hypothetical protein